MNELKPSLVLAVSLWWRKNITLLISSFIYHFAYLLDSILLQPTSCLNGGTTPSRPVCIKTSCYYQQAVSYITHIIEVTMSLNFENYLSCLVSSHTVKKWWPEQRAKQSIETMSNTAIISVIIVPVAFV